MSDNANLPLVVAITGASGAVYAARLLQCLAASGIPLHVVISPSGAEVIRQELNLQLGAERKTPKRTATRRTENIHPPSVKIGH